MILIKKLQKYQRGYLVKWINMKSMQGEKILTPDQKKILSKLKLSIIFLKKLVKIN